MANEILERDSNRVTVLGGVTDDANQFITQLRIDPATGRLKVSATGVSIVSSNVLSLEIPSGTVNGVNTVFTVQNNPLFEEVSGQVMVSSTQDATNYGYTISGSGPYTITFLSAPQSGQTPHSFYNNIGSSSSLSSFFQTDSFTSTSNQTVFTSSITPLFVFSFVVNDQSQTNILDYVQSGGTFTLNNGIPAGLTVTITYLHA